MVFDEMKHFFDTKNHLLYGIENLSACADDENTAICMAYEAYQRGCRFIMATPSDDAFLNAQEASDAKGIVPWLWNRYESLRSKIHRYMPDMELGLGCEIACSRNTMDDILWHLKNGHLPALNGSNYVLVSFADNVSLEDLWFCLDKLDQANYSPVLSHAQSLQVLTNNIHEIRCLKGDASRGTNYHFRCLIQLDTLSLHFSEHTRDWAREMIRCGVVDLLGTNARNTSTNPPHIREEIESFRNLCSPEYLDSIAWSKAAGLFHK